MSKQGFIYKYTYPNGKIYIGQTRVGVKERHYQHMSASQDPCRRTICELAIAKYGEPLLETIETIEVDDKESSKLVEKLNEAEKKWIEFYDSTVKSGKGYNVREGGEMTTPEEIILQEKWYEIYKKDNWCEKIAYIKEVIDSIGKKMFITNEKLSKEENRIWYGYEFICHRWSFIKGKASFSRFYSQMKHLADIGDVDYSLYEIVDNPNSTIEAQEKSAKEIDKQLYDSVMRLAIEELIENIRQTIWAKIMKKKDKIIRDYLNKKN